MGEKKKTLKVVMLKKDMHRTHQENTKEGEAHDSI